MDKRSRRRTRDLVTQAASQGLSQNEIGCARISMMARSTNAPCKGRIQMRKTNPSIFQIRLATHGRSIQLGHVWTAPWQELSDALQHWSGAVTCPAC
jgi:hypothetical protein